ncbi:hypothetical protein TNCV_3365301 [Trichonephila clavipes]|nr:hypothetical protein TNCV_3365301 [Trichonephila clavipes]
MSRSGGQSEGYNWCSRKPRHGCAHMTDLYPCLIVGMRQSRLLACAGVVQTCTHPVVGKSAKDDFKVEVGYFLPPINRPGFVGK